MLLLGAGASLSSGASSTDRIIDDVVRSAGYETDIPWKDKEAAFYQILDGLSSEERQAKLNKHLAVLDPSVGYRLLTELISAGYFDIIFTTNIDPLLDQCLKDSRLSTMDYEVYVVDKIQPGEVVNYLRCRTPRVKVVKLHGDLKSRNIKFTPQETFRFDLCLEEELKKFLSKDTIIIGLSVRDRDIQLCLDRVGGSIWYVNRTAPLIGHPIMPVLIERKSKQHIIDKEEGGLFDDFLSALYEELGMPPLIVKTLAPHPALEKEYLTGKLPIDYVETVGAPVRLACYITETHHTDDPDPKVPGCNRLSVHLRIEPCPKCDPSSCGKETFIGHDLRVGFYDKFGLPDTVRCSCEKHLHEFSLNKTLTLLTP